MDKAEVVKRLAVARRRGQNAAKTVYRMRGARSVLEWLREKREREGRAA
jgi:hypothetical protein